MSVERALDKPLRCVPVPSNTFIRSGDCTMRYVLRKIPGCIAMLLLALPVVSVADEEETWSAHGDTKREACSIAKEIAEGAARIAGAARIGGGIAITGSSCDCEQLLDGRWTCDATVRYRLIKDEDAE